MSLTRVAKKLLRNLDGVDAAIIMCNASDPQLATLAAFYDAVDGLPQFTVLNKTDMVLGEQIRTTTEKLPGEVIPASMATGRGLTEIEYRLDRWVHGDTGVKKVAILGVFNSGKTSLINALTGESNPVDDIPGTTLLFSEHSYQSLTLMDSVGQLVDVNKPFMVSMDFSDCETRADKITKCFTSSIDALIATLPVILDPVGRAIDMLLEMVEEGSGKLITCGAGASALVAEEIAGQAQETGLPVMVFTNNFASSQPVSFAKGAFEDEYALADYYARAVNPGDIVLGVSASGGTGFVFELLRIAREKGAKTIAITENSDTPLGKNADIIIKSEAKPEGPSSSRVQVAHLVIGYALVLLVADARGIDAEKAIQYMLPEKTRNKKMGIK